MENKNTIKYKDSKVWTRKIKGSWGINPHDCFCCNKSIKTGEEATLLINNYEYIPNILIHSECLDAQGGITEGLLNDIEKSYQQYKMLTKVFG